MDGRGQCSFVALEDIAAPRQKRSYSARRMPRIRSEWHRRNGAANRGRQKSRRSGKIERLGALWDFPLQIELFWALLGATMPVPISQMWTVATYLLKQKVAGRKR